MGKGASAPTETTNSNSDNLPEYVRPYFERLLGRTEAESKREYEPYGGQRIADTSQDLLTSEDMVRDIASTGLPGIQTAYGKSRSIIDFTPRQFTVRKQINICHHFNSCCARQKARGNGGLMTTSTNSRGSSQCYISRSVWWF